MIDELSFRQGGRWAPLLVLLHGLGATGAVWTPMLAEAARRWTGRWIAPDLPGHGASRPLVRYRTDDYAAHLGPVIAAAAAGDPVWLLGHSLGGTIALSLARGTFGFEPAAVHSFGIKIDWTAEELHRFSGFAARSPRMFDSEEEALAQHARFAGLDPLSSPELLDNGARRTGAQWHAALDLKTFAVEPPDMARLCREARCPVNLARGADDPMVTLKRLRDFDPGAVEIANAGHNAMVDKPDGIWEWIGR